MNWIIRKSKKLRCHTDLKGLLEPILSELDQYKWFLTDLDFMVSVAIPINFEEDYFILNNDELLQIMNSRAQIIWGVISAVPKELNILIDENNLPNAENEFVWKNGNLQIENSIIEIIAWDSSYTIIKFKDEILSNKFKAFFDEAIPLEKFK